MRVFRVLPLVLMSCLSAQTFNDRGTAVSCKRYEECFKADFDSAYDNQKECRDDVGQFTSDCYATHCDFDAKAANQCLKDAAKQSCDEFGSELNASCTGVWDDCDGIALGLCLVADGFDTF